ncbi:MAG: hypothetical protein KDD33_13400 [Bdellovibrionales bacterium]|nr:hypothetical protein [Bdellovibrionales bacterium]
MSNRWMTFFIPFFLYLVALPLEAQEVIEIDGKSYLQTGTNNMAPPSVTGTSVVLPNGNTYTEMSFQNGNCQNGYGCPGAPTPAAKPGCVSGNEPGCGGSGSGGGGRDAGGAKSTASTKEDSTDTTNQGATTASTEPSGPTGPSAQCQNAVGQTSSCSQAPGVSGANTAHNILGNYDAVSAQLNQSSQTLNAFASRCQALINRCASACNTGNPYDSQLQGQCYQNQGVVGGAKAEASRLDGISQKVQAAAQEIRSGESDINKGTDNIGHGQSLSKLSPSLAKVSGNFNKFSISKGKGSVSPSRFHQLNEKSGQAVAAGSQAVVDNPYLSGGRVGAAAVSMAKAGDDSEARALRKEKEEHLFTKISRKIFNGFLGVGGKSKKSGVGLSRDSGGSDSEGRSLNSTKVAKGLLSPEDILRQKWEKSKNRRGLAGLASDEFIFHTMCIRYDLYERKHDIQEGQTECPPAH